MAEARQGPARTRRLRAGHTYFDLDHPEQGPFVATGEEVVAPNANVVDQADMDEESWENLLADGFGVTQIGAGDRAYDQGAFGQEDNPRSDVLNSAPPGVGERLTPTGTEEEQRRR